MRKQIGVAAVTVVGLLAGTRPVDAQSAILNLPRASQHARVAQRIGITDITIDYHRPLTRGRKIFGVLEAYDRVWRAGANENTTFEVTDAVAIDGNVLPKGVYGLHMIPGEQSWVVVFSKNATSWGSFTYDQAEDALRVTVKPRAIESRDALSYEFDELTPTSAVLTMRWEKVAVSVKVDVDTAAIVQRSLRNQLRARAQFEWQPWMEAANYLLTNNLGADEAAQYAQRSIDIEDRFENEITKSLALGVLGRKAEAIAARDRAVALGNQPQIHTFGRGLQADGRYQEALDLFRSNIKKDPASWVAHNEMARLAVAGGDFATAVKEMKLAAAIGPEALKEQHLDLVRRLQNRDDINK